MAISPPLRTDRVQKTKAHKGKCAGYGEWNIRGGVTETKRNKEGEGEKRLRGINTT